MRYGIRVIAAAAAAWIMMGAVSFAALAGGYANLAVGAYPVKAALSCYVNAMGGVEFGAPLLTSATVNVEADGSRTMTLHFTKSQVSIYSITCDTFIDVSPSYVTETNGVKSGTLGYYRADGELVTDSVTYTLADDTAENARQERVHYVDSLTFPLIEESDTYRLTLFVNSNVMGTQFTNDGYPATLTVDWSSVGAAESSREDDAGRTEAAVATTAGNVETRAGLHIYSPEGETVDAVQPEVSGTYTAHFKKGVLAAVGAAAGAILLIGGILVISGKKEKTS